MMFLSYFSNDESAAEFKPNNLSEYHLGIITDCRPTWLRRTGGPKNKNMTHRTRTAVIVLGLLLCLSVYAQDKIEGFDKLSAAEVRQAV